MSIIKNQVGGQIGSPEMADYLNALGQLADVIAKNGDGIEIVAVPEAGVALFQEANAAAASGMKRTIRFEIRDAAGNVQKWYNGTGTLTPGETCTDAQIGVPVITGGNTIQFVDGVAEVEVVVDTDEGSTKTYANADLVTVACAVANVAGVAVGTTHATYTLTFEQTPLLVAYIEGTEGHALAPTIGQANSAGASSFRQRVNLRLEDSEGNLQTWFDGHLHLVASENVTDAQVSKPSLLDEDGAALTDTTGELTIDGGEAAYYMVFDTDAGATKTYVHNDYVTVTPVIANIGGVAVTVTEAVVVATFEP